MIWWRGCTRRSPDCTGCAPTRWPLSRYAGPLGFEAVDAVLSAAEW